MQKSTPPIFDYTTYGATATASQVISFVQHVLKTNQQAEGKGKKKTPICIWGRHGIGKTETLLTTYFSLKFLSVMTPN